MCGISGIVTRQPLAPELVAPVRRMSAAQAHRGPDGEGEHRGSHTLLAMRRLSIIDPAGGAQPLYNEDRSVALIANGEIYNAPELRDALENRRPRFRTGSDCEVITHLYEGMASIACGICAECSPSHSGTSPAAVWCWPGTAWERSRSISTNDRECCCSHRSSRVCFLQGSWRSSSIPRPSINTFTTSSLPEPRTPIRGVRKLEAAHVLVVDADPWNVEDRCYWSMEDAPPIEAEPAVVLRERLEDIAGHHHPRGS